MKLFVQITYNNLSNSISELTTEDNIIYKYLEDIHGEYFKIESNGNLGFYTKEGNKFNEAKKYE